MEMKFSLLARARRALLVPSVVASLAAGGGPARAQDPSPQAKVARRKALFIEQFTRLVEWPPSALPREGPFVLCTQGTSDTAAELAKIAAVRKFKDRPAEVRQTRAGAGLDHCHVLYLAASEASHLHQTLAATADRPILTVSDTQGFGERGVQFNLFEEIRSVPQPGTYVSFELNAPAVKRSMLAFDPRLLSAGRRVDTAPAGDPKPRRPGPPP